MWPTIGQDNLVGCFKHAFTDQKIKPCGVGFYWSWQIVFLNIDLRIWCLSMFEMYCVNIVTG